jgi:hypothetical protein
VCAIQAKLFLLKAQILSGKNRQVAAREAALHLRKHLK